ncbi:hypothetical protein CRENBAI_004500 [Crenichthys baileyi]|uniref:Uncharacterized protein n=1 Tax=Crenichthys baileyi TaxID=28760 RepID=A0AAV9RN26_9TELE
MLPTRLHSGVPHNASLNRMFPPNLDLADRQKDDALDRWVERQKEEAMRNLPTDLEVLPSPLLLEQMEREIAQRQRVREGCFVPPPHFRRSPPASVPAAKPPSSSRRRNRRRARVNSRWAGEEVVSLPAVVRAPATKPAPSSATAKFPRLTAAPPMPSSLAPARCSEATPDELEEQLRFFARQIKSFRRTSLMYSSPELMERIRQIEGDYETADSRELLLLLQSSPRQDSRELLLLLQSSPRQDSRELLLQSSPRQDSRELLLQSSPRQDPGELLLQSSPTPGDSRELAAAEQPTPGLQGVAAAAAEQPTPGLQGAAAAEQPTPGLQGAAAAEQPTPGLQGAAAAEQPTPGLQGAAAAEQPTPGLQPAVLSTFSVFSGGCSRNSSLTHHDTLQARHTTDSRPDPKSASTSSTRRRGRRKRDSLAQVIGGLCDASAPPAHVSEGPANASAPSLQGFSGKLVLVLASEPCNEGFEEEEPPDHVSEGLKEQLVLILASEPCDEGSRRKRCRILSLRGSRSNLSSF